MKRLGWLVIIMIISVFPSGCRDDLTDSSSRNNLPGWASIGLDGKFIETLVITQDALYAGVGDPVTLTPGGVFKKGLPNGEWVSLGLSDKIVWSIYVHPKLSHIIYTVTSSTGPVEGLRLYRSTNGGETWSPIQMGMEWTWQITGSPVDPLRLFAVGDHLYRSTDGGESWEPMQESWYLKIHSVDVPVPRTLYAGGENPAFQPKLLKSTDDGKTWTDLSNFNDAGIMGDNNVMSLAIHPDDPQILYAGMEGSLIRSMDGGATWEGLLSPGDTGFVGAIFDPDDPDHIFTGGWIPMPLPWRPRFFGSTDGGQTWQEQDLPFDRGIRVLVHDKTRTNVLYAGTAGAGVWRLTY
ncbi:MAG: hypothetical protein IT393_03565 [Nitrospirae bacterium]|nr:hypothetical protein [Nitrospirota bacterium]